MSSIIDSPSGFFSLFRSFVRESHSVVIMSHRNPDDDAISSVLTLYWYFKESFPDLSVYIYFSGDTETRWRYFEYFDHIHFVSESALDFSRFDLFLGVDACELHRFVQTISLFDHFKGKFIFIDHHPTSPPSCNLAIVRPDYPACSYLLYDILFKDRTAIPPRLAEIILLGILGDTGNFRYIDARNTDIFLASARLVHDGNINIQTLMSRYSLYSEKIFLGVRALANNVHFHTIPSWPPFMYAYLTPSFITSNSLSDSDITAICGIFISQYGTSLAEYSWSMVFTPRSNGDVIVSLRSRPGSVNVRLIGQESGWGGGHDRAAGVKLIALDGSPLDVDAAIQQMFDWLSRHTPTFS